MQNVTVDFEGGEGYLRVIGDLHIGDKAFTRKMENKLIEDLEEVKGLGGKVFLNGDVFNCPTRASKTSPFEQDKDEFNYAINLLKPYAGMIVGANDGNHEHRLEDFANFSVMNAFCQAMKIPYCGNSSTIKVKVLRKDDKRFRETYIGYLHHTTGGGRKPGAKLNRIKDLAMVLPNADFYCGAHTHQRGAFPGGIMVYNTRKEVAELKEQWFIGGGSYLDWDNTYAERMMLEPAIIGSPVIKFDGNKRNITVKI